MLVAFRLSMPNVGSWNGKWSGEGNLYARVRNFRRKGEWPAAQRAVAKGHYYYSWGDGWGASVTVWTPTPQEARQIRRKSRGFCGYDWMIASILEHDEIIVEVRP